MTVSMRSTWPNLSYIFSQCLDPVLDPRPGPAVLLAVGQHLAVEAGVQAAAQEGQDVLGGEVQAGVVEQPRVEVGQGRPVLEEDVGVVFGLVDDPVIALTSEPGLAEQRVDLAGPAVQDLDPSEGGSGRPGLARAGSSSWVKALSCCTGPLPASWSCRASQSWPLR